MSTVFGFQVKKSSLYIQFILPAPTIHKKKKAGCALRVLFSVKPLRSPDLRTKKQRHEKMMGASQESRSSRTQSRLTLNLFCFLLSMNKFLRTTN